MVMDCLDLGNMHITSGCLTVYDVQLQGGCVSARSWAVWTFCWSGCDRHDWECCQGTQGCVEVGLARTMHIRCICTVCLAINYQIYGGIRCIYTILANPMCRRGLGWCARGGMNVAVQGEGALKIQNDMEICMLFIKCYARNGPSLTGYKCS